MMLTLSFLSFLASQTAMDAQADLLHRHSRHRPPASTRPTLSHMPPTSRLLPFCGCSREWSLSRGGGASPAAAFLGRQWGLIGGGGLDNLASGIFNGVDSVDELALGRGWPQPCETGPPRSAGGAPRSRAEVARHRRACPRRVRVLYVSCARVSCGCAWRCGWTGCGCG